MRCFCVIFCVSVLGILAAHAVQVNGSAYLSGQQNHSGIKVLFREVSPSAQTDSVFTDAAGQFQINLQPGVYDVEYSHVTYALYRLPNQVLLFNTTLDSVLLMPPLSGYLSGTIGPGDFQVTDSIVVAANAALTILPGTRLYFDGMHRFIVRGLLTAIGTWDSTIVFTRRYSVSADTMWNGIVMLYANDLTRLVYVVVEYAYRDYDENPMYHEGAALFCQGTNVHIYSSMFRHNFASGFGSHIYFDACAPYVYGCTFVENEVYGYGVVKWAGASPTFELCFFQQNHGTALYGGSGHGTITRCRFEDNTGNEANDILAINVTVDQCIFFQSSAVSGCAVTLGNSAEMTRCTLFGHGDSYRAMIALNDSAVASSCVVFAVSGSGVYFLGAAQSQVRYCDIFAPNGRAFQFIGNDSSQGPPAIGLIALTNANGDSCDTYYNILADPLFVDTTNWDYRLTANSPCIDAGDPQLPHDPDGTVADMGAFYFGEENTADDSFILPLSSFVLYAYPNPFNSATQIMFDVPRAGIVEMNVYDVTGREIKTLVHEQMSAGRHEISFDARDLASGIYFYRLRSGEFLQTRKMVLIK